MTSVFPLSLSVGFSLIALSINGCAQIDGTTPISGSVQFDGQPVVYGEIVFKPDEAKGHTGPHGFALIKNGAFSTESTGQGVIAGPHIVHLTGYSEVPVGSEDENNPPPPVRPIFTGYTLPVVLDGTPLSLSVPPEARQTAVESPKKKSKR